MRTLKFIGDRSLYLLPQLFGISLLTFFAVRLLPGNPAVMLLGPGATDEAVAIMSERMGLTKPIAVQYFIYIKNLFSGDFGMSWSTGSPVVVDLMKRVPATLELITLALIISIVIFVPLGRVTAIHGNSAIKKGVIGYGLSAGAFPDFWLGLILIYVFFFRLNIAPAPMGRIDLLVSAPKSITGFYLIDSVLTWNWEAFLSALWHLVLPVLTLVFVYGGPILKMTQTTMSKEMSSSYIKHSYAIGLNDKTVQKYAMKNSLPPVVTIIGITYSYLLGGAVLVETVFGWGGLGQYAVTAIQNSDYAPIQAFVLLAALLNLVVYLIVDMVYFMINPKIEI